MIDPHTERLMMGAAGAAGSKAYVDDVFSTYVYKGNATARSITNGIDLAGEGGLVWTKGRDYDVAHNLIDTVRGNTKLLYSNGNYAEGTFSNVITGFNSNGYSLGTDSTVMMANKDDKEFASWTFRKTEGFFDVVTYTGNGSNRTISHNLGTVPGMIIVKKTSDTSPWTVYHKSLPASQNLTLNTQGLADNSTDWNSTAPTASVFSLGNTSDVNGNGDEFVAYLWGGGASTAATARSVEFDKSGDYLNTTSSSSDFTMGTGDFTVECWVKMDSTSVINGFWQISPNSGGFDSNYGNTLAVAWDHQAGEGWQIYGAGTYSKTGLNVSHP